MPFVNKVRSILQSSPNAWMERGVSAVTPIIVAAQNNHSTLLDLLATAAPQSILLEDTYGENAISYIINFWDDAERMVKLIDQSGKPIDQSYGVRNDTNAHTAARNGSLECFIELVTRKPKLLTTTNVLGQTPTEVVVLEHNQNRETHKVREWLTRNHPHTFAIPNTTTGLTPFDYGQRMKIAEIADAFLKFKAQSLKRKPSRGPVA